jgi:hypothetical protein
MIAFHPRARQLNKAPGSMATGRAGCARSLSRAAGTLLPLSLLAAVGCRPGGVAETPAATEAAEAQASQAQPAEPPTLTATATPALTTTPTETRAPTETATPPPTAAETPAPGATGPAAADAPAGFTTFEIPHWLSLPLPDGWRLIRPRSPEYLTFSNSDQDFPGFQLEPGVGALAEP